MKITLYSYWRSSSAHRVRIALGFKGIEHETVAVNLLAGEQSSDEHKKRAPSGFVPALVIDGEAFVESVAIIELLDDLFTDAPLYPKKARERARVRAIVETINSGIQPLQNLAVLLRHSDDHDKRTAWAHHFNRRGVEVIERLMEKHGEGRFAYGDNFTAADAFLIPQVLSAKRFGVNVDEFPRVAQAIATTSELPFVKAAAPEAQPDAPAT
jgi:maleylacetoacetate isomerase